MNISTTEQGNEVEDVYEDYMEMLEHLKAQGNDETPTLEEFAIWRREEFLANDQWAHPVPSIN